MNSSQPKDSAPQSEEMPLADLWSFIYVLCFLCTLLAAIYGNTWFLLRIFNKCPNLTVIKQTIKISSHSKPGKLTMSKLTLRSISASNDSDTGSVSGYSTAESTTRGSNNDTSTGHDNSDRDIDSIGTNGTKSSKSRAPKRIQTVMKIQLGNRLYQFHLNKAIRRQNIYVIKKFKKQFGINDIIPQSKSEKYDYYLIPISKHTKWSNDFLLSSQFEDLYYVLRKISPKSSELSQSAKINKKNKKYINKDEDITLAINLQSAYQLDYISSPSLISYAQMQSHSINNNNMNLNIKYNSIANSSNIINNNINNNHQTGSRRDSIKIIMDRSMEMPTQNQDKTTAVGADRVNQLQYAYGGEAEIFARISRKEASPPPAAGCNYKRPVPGLCLHNLDPNTIARQGIETVPMTATHYTNKIPVITSKDKENRNNHNNNNNNNINNDDIVTKHTSVELKLKPDGSSSNHDEIQLRSQGGETACPPGVVVGNGDTNTINNNGTNMNSDWYIDEDYDNDDSCDHEDNINIDGPVVNFQKSVSTSVRIHPPVDPIIVDQTGVKYHGKTGHNLNRGELQIACTPPPPNESCNNNSREQSQSPRPPRKNDVILRIPNTCIVNPYKINNQSNYLPCCCVSNCLSKKRTATTTTTTTSKTKTSSSRSSSSSSSSSKSTNNEELELFRNGCTGFILICFTLSIGFMLIDSIIHGLIKRDWYMRISEYEQVARGLVVLGSLSVCYIVFISSLYLLDNKHFGVSSHVIRLCHCGYFVVVLFHGLAVMTFNLYGTHSIYSSIAWFCCAIYAVIFYTGIFVLFSKKTSQIARHLRYQMFDDPITVNVTESSKTNNISKNQLRNLNKYISNIKFLTFPKTVKSYTLNDAGSGFAILAHKAVKFYIVSMLLLFTTAICTGLKIIDRMFLDNLGCLDNIIIAIACAFGIFNVILYLEENVFLYMQCCLCCHRCCIKRWLNRHLKG